MYFVCRSLFFLGETFLNRKQWLTLEHADINRYHDTGAVVLDRNLLQLPGFYDNPSDKKALVSSNDERLTQILYETLNSVETHFWRRETSRGKVTTDVQTTATDGRDVRVSEMLVGGLERFTGQRESVLLLCR